MKSSEDERIERRSLMEGSERQRAALFGERATSRWYDSAYDRVTADGHALRARMDVALGLIGPGPGFALDAGMGPGRLLAELYRRGWTVTGLDMSAEMVAAARRRIPTAAERLVRGDIEAVPYAGPSFDVVVATGVLEYADPAVALAELVRVLRPGGRAVVSYPNTSAFYSRWKGNVYYPLVEMAKRLLRRPIHTWPGGAGPIPPAEFAERLRAAGLEPESMTYASFLVIPAPIDSIVPRLSASLGRRLEGRGPRLGRWFGTQIVYAARKPSIG